MTFKSPIQPKPNSVILECVLRSYINCPQRRAHSSLFPVTYEVADRRCCFCEDSVQDLLKNITSDGFMNLNEKEQ